MEKLIEGGFEGALEEDFLDVLSDLASGLACSAALNLLDILPKELSVKFLS